MGWKQIDPAKYDAAMESRLLANIQRLKAEMEEGRHPISQVDGSTIHVLQFEQVKAYHKAVQEFHDWVRDCMKD
jgi:hypothetical protein